MSTSRNDVYVKCPFYKSDKFENAYRIYCEGLVDNSSIILTYRKKMDFKTHIKEFCCLHFEQCLIYQALMKKYE